MNSLQNARAQFIKRRCFRYCFVYVFKNVSCRDAKPFEAFMKKAFVEYSSAVRFAVRCRRCDPAVTDPEDIGRVLTPELPSIRK